jgi:hypothetical protein
MARYGLIWLEIAHADYTSLPEHTRDQFSAWIEQLLENPRQPRDGYDELTDQWTTTYGGAGLIVYDLLPAAPGDHRVRQLVREQGGDQRQRADPAGHPVPVDLEPRVLRDVARRHRARR